MTGTITVALVVFFGVLTLRALEKLGRKIDELGDQVDGPVGQGPEHGGE